MEQALDIVNQLLELGLLDIPLFTVKHAVQFRCKVMVAKTHRTGILLQLVDLVCSFDRLVPLRLSFFVCQRYLEVHVRAQVG
jgi:hypothetical protein